MTSTYPASFEDIRAWAQAAGVPVAEARVRFAQYAVLRSISAVRPLRVGLVFKGGNALDFIWQPNRSTVDLDFSVDHASFLGTPDANTIRTLLGRGIAVASANLGVMMAVQRVRPNPPGEDKHFVTFRARIAYALPDQPRPRQRLAQGEAIPQGIDLDISINEPIGAASLVDVAPGVQIRVATIEDIVAEKLRALLQQPIRDRQRRQDLLDVAVILSQHPGLNYRLVSEFLLMKAAARGVLATRSAFRNPEITERAHVGYAALAGTTRVLFLPFDEALELLYELVNALQLPE